MEIILTILIILIFLIYIFFGKSETDEWCKREEFNEMLDRAETEIDKSRRKRNLNFLLSEYYHLSDRIHQAKRFDDVCGYLSYKARLDDVLKELEEIDKDSNNGNK